MFSPFTAQAAQARIPAGWSASEDVEHDYAVVSLQAPVGSTVGWFGTRVASDADLQGRHVRVAGYAQSFSSARQLVFVDTEIAAQDQSRIYYPADFEPGCSGSPVWFDDGSGGISVVAIHAGGPDRSPSHLNGLSSATRITPAIQQLFAPHVA